MIFERYQDKVKHWLTFNEINAGTMELGIVLSTGTFHGYEGPITEVSDNPQARHQTLHHQFVASAKVVKYAHENYPHFKMGNMIALIVSYPHTCNPVDILMAQNERKIQTIIVQMYNVRENIRITQNVFGKRIM